jgi:hypothetical protein
MIPLPNVSIAAALKLGLAAVVALALGLLIHQRDHWKSVAADRQAQLMQTQSAFDRTVADYRAAADKARVADAANLMRVKAQQDAINSDREKSYETRIGAARAAAQRLRAQFATEAHSGAGGTTPMPRLPAAAEGAAQTAGEDRLSIDDRELATEQAIQLDELIKWVRRQAAVRQEGQPGGIP